MSSPQMLSAASARKAGAGRPHIYELDMLRIVTAVCVVGVHVVFFTTFLSTTAASLQLQDAIVALLHFTREAFMFVTGLALTYVYFGKPFSWRRFWSKRSIGVLLPYVLWTLVYVVANAHPQSVGSFITTSLYDIFTGSASYQLYYILLTLQFYLILPVFLAFLARVRSHPWITLAVSFAIQVVVLYVDYRYVETRSSFASPALGFFATYQNRFVLMYQFYFILGGLVALNLEQVRAFVVRHGKLLVAAAVAGLALLWAHYFYLADIQHDSLVYVVQVLQPVMTPYSLAAILFLGWVAVHWARTRGKDGRPRSARAWGLLSDASFGIYLVHPLFLTAMGNWGIPRLAPVLPGAIVTLLTWAIVAGLSIGLTIALMKTPILSRTVGRKQPMPQLTPITTWFNSKQAQERKAA